jgi:hypothetical protein
MVWNDLKNNKTVLICNGKTFELSDMNKKTIQRAGEIFDDFKCWKYQGKYERTFILDMSDKNRTNEIYLELMAKFKINQKLWKCSNFFSSKLYTEMVQFNRQRYGNNRRNL